MSFFICCTHFRYVIFIFCIFIKDFNIFHKINEIYHFWYLKMFVVLLDCNEKTAKILIYGVYDVIVALLSTEEGCTQ